MEGLDNTHEKNDREKIRSYYEGVSFISPLGHRYNAVDVTPAQEDLSLRGTFLDRAEVKEIIASAKEFRDEHQNTFNGVLLGNPSFIGTESDSLQVNAERLHYFIYFAAHKLVVDKELAEKEAERYAALSVSGVVFNPQTQEFYLSIRPDDSAEDPGFADAAGGTLNPDSPQASDPLETIENRFQKKLGLLNTKPACVGVARMFNDKYSLYNLVYLGTFTGGPEEVTSSVQRVSIHHVVSYLTQDKVTTPGRASLLLALSQKEFEQFGWGKERVMAFLEEITAEGT